MSSGPDYASSIATATDLAGRSWAAWSDNGQIYAAHWDSAANRWSDAAVISNATGGRNVQLTLGQLVRDSKTGQDLPALVVSWEAGIDNDADVLAAVGFYRPDGTVLWSDAVNLLPGGVAENNHSIGISGNRLVLATEAQAVVNPLATGPADGKASQYQDSEINTYSVAIASRASGLGTGDPNYLQTFSGSSWSGRLTSLVTANGISNGQLISSAVNGVPLSLGQTTSIPGLGDFTLSADGQLSYNRGSNPASELLFTGELIGTGVGNGRSYARSSALLRPSELIQPSNNGYTITVSTLNGAGNVIGTSSVPLRFNASERLERVTASTFAPRRPTGDGSALRAFTGSGQFSDASLGRALAAANGQTSLERTALLSQSVPGSFGEWAEQAFLKPYVVYKGQLGRFNISIGDLLGSLTGAGSGSIPLLSSLTSKTGFNIGLDGFISYLTSGPPGSQKLDATGALNLSFGRIGTKNDISRNRIAENKDISRNRIAERNRRVPGRSALKPAGGTDARSRNSLATSQAQKGKKVRVTFDKVAQSQGRELEDRSEIYAEANKTGRGYLLSDRSIINRQRFRIEQENERALRSANQTGFDSYGNSATARRNRQLNAAITDSAQAAMQRVLQKPQAPLDSTSAYLPGSIQTGYLFGWVPVRAAEVNFASVERYSYSTSRAIGLAAPSLESKRFQFGVGLNLGVVGTINLGLTSVYRDEDTDQPTASAKQFSVLDIQGELGAKFNVNIGLGFSDPVPPLPTSLQWSEDYERAYLPIYEKASSFWQGLFLGSYAINQGISIAAPYVNNKAAIRRAGDDPSSLGAGGLGKLGGALSAANLGAQFISQFPFLYTAGDIIFSNNLASGSFRSKGENPTVTFSAHLYANGSISFLNGLIAGYTRNSTGATFVFPSGVGWQYSMEAGYSVGGISQTLWNIRGTETITGDDSGFIANTFLEGAPTLTAALYGYPDSAVAGLSQPISTPTIQLPVSGGSINLAALANPSLQPALATPLANGDLALSVYAVVVAPSEGAVDASGNFSNFKLSFSGSALPLRVLLDSRALLSGQARLGVPQPWQTLINQWSTPGASTTTGVLAGIKPGTAIPLRLELRIPKGTDLGSIGPYSLGFNLDGNPGSFGTAAAPLLAAMPGSPVQRDVSGSSFELGTSASGTIGAATTAVDPYIASFVVAAAGRGYSDTDFILEQGGAVIRGRLNTEVTAGSVTGADLFQTASSKDFAGPAYVRLSDADLRARLSSGADAQISLSARDGRLTGVELALAGDSKTALAGSGYLAGGTGEFSQWVNGTPLTTGSIARALLRLVVRDGQISEIGILRQEGSFAVSQPATISLANSVAGAGSGLALVPILRTSVDTNLLDDSGLSIGSFQRYVDGSFKSEADLVYTQGGADRTKPINGSINLDLPLIVNRLAPDGRGWTRIAFIDPPSTDTPGVDGFNFDSSSNSLYFNNDVLGGKRTVVLLSHVDLSAIQTRQDLYLLEDALQQAQVYAALERKDAANNLFFSTPVLLSDPSQAGTNSNGRILPFYAVKGAGVAPLPDANSQLLAAWVHTSPDGQAEIQVRVGSASGIATSGNNDTSSINWGPISSIALPAKVNGDEVTELGLTYLDGRTPVLSWSLNSLTPYQEGVLRGNPTAYYRLDDLPSQGTLANISSSDQPDGQLAAVGEISRYSSWMDTAAAPLTQADILSTDGALLNADLASPQPGDPDPALQFGGGVFAEVPNVFLNRLTGASSEQPSGYAADVWINTSVADGEGSILDNGLYNPGAVLPTVQQLQLPVLLRRTASTESIEGVDTKGYRYSLVVAAGTYADLGAAGLGSGLSPFNLRFAAQDAPLSFSSSSAGSYSFDFKGADLNDFVQYRTKGGALTSFTLGEQEVELASSFVADASSAGTTKIPEVITYSSGKVGLLSSQIQGWSLRKRVVNGQQVVDFNYGRDRNTGAAATLSGVLPSGSWSHIAISYGEEQGSSTKAARLFIDGQLAAEQLENPANIRGYDFNLLPYQLGHHFKGSLDELVLSDRAITNPVDLLRGRLATRYVDPRSATQATYFSPGVYDSKTNSWSWQEAGPFIKADYIPSTIPGAINPGPVDMAGANGTAELRADGKADLHTTLHLRGIAVGSLVTGIRVRVTAPDGSSKDYAIGDGLRYGLDGTAAASSPVSGLIGVVSSGAGLNSGAGGKAINFAVMGDSVDLDLYLPADSSSKGSSVQIGAIIRSPQNRAEGGDRFNLWSPDQQPVLDSGVNTTILSRYYSSKNVAASLPRSANPSLLDINTGYAASLAQTNEPTIADPVNQTYAEAIASGKINNIPFVAIANPNLAGIGGTGSQRGVIWVLPYAGDAKDPLTANKLQALQSLVGTPESRLDAEAVFGVAIVGRDGMQLGGSILWADLNGDGHDELIIAGPRSDSSAGVAASGCLIVINGTYLASKAASGNKRIDLNDATTYNDTTNVRVFNGQDGSEFGSALAFGKITTNGNALLIGAPGYSTRITTNYKGETIALDDQKTYSVGAVYQLNADANLFKGSSAEPFLLISGDLPGLANFNYGVESTDRRFGAAIALTSATYNRDFTSDGIADIAIGSPGLTQSRLLKGGINPRATTAQRDADLALRSTLPDVYREGIDETSSSDPRDVTMGGVLLLEGGASSADQLASKKKVLLLGDTVFGDAAGAGSAIASGGDFNNDNVDDLAVGMPEVDSKTGAVSLISGATIRNWFRSATATNYTDIKTNQRSAVVDAALIIQNDQPNGLYGRSMALNGDVNVDGIADLVIGDANFAEYSGRVNVLFGSGNFGGDVKGQTLAKGPTGTTIYHRLDITNPSTRLDIYSSSFGEGLGRSVLLAPTGKSVNNTPTTNLLLPSSNGSSTLLGLYAKPLLKGLGSFSARDLGSSEGIEISGLIRRPTITPSYGLLGDVNGDGNADAFVDLDPTPDQARFRLSFGSGAGFSPDHQDAGTGGSSNLDLTAILRLQNPGARGFSLRDVLDAGDLNSDGIHDLLIRYGYNLGGRNLERSAILLGGDLLTSNVLLQSAVLRPISPLDNATAPGDTLLPGQILSAGEYLLSPNGHFMATIQKDGNFVVQTRRSDMDAWDVSFSLDVYTPQGSGSSLGYKSDSFAQARLRLGSDGKLYYAYDIPDPYSFPPRTTIDTPLTSGTYRRNGNNWAVTANGLPANTTLKGLSIRDDGSLLATASDGSTVFSFVPSYNAKIISSPIPADKLVGSTLKLAAGQPLAQAPLSPIGTAITTANGDAPTLLGVATANGTTELRWLNAQDRAVDIGLLYDTWFAAFPRPSTADEQASLDSFNSSLKQQLRAFDPAASDAAQVSADNLDLVADTLESIVAGAGASFRNFVEGRSPVFAQQSVTLLQTYGDPPSSNLLASGTLPVQSGDLLLPGQRMVAGDYLLSPNGRFTAKMQDDGNFVVQTRRSDINAWDVSFSLNDYLDKNYFNNKVPIRSGTSLELRNGKLTFVNDIFVASKGSNAIAIQQGFYVRGGTTWKVNVNELPVGASLSEVRLGDDGVLRAKASDGSTVFSFEPRYDNNIISDPIPAANLQGYGRMVTGYDTFNLSGRSTTLVDRNGNGLPELLIGPSASDPSLYVANLSGPGASDSNSWFVTPISQSNASSGNFLWESAGDHPANALSADQVGTVDVRKINGYTKRASRTSPYLLEAPVETGGDLGVNGASLSRQMLILGGLHQTNSYGQYSRSIGGADLSRRLSQDGESFELKLPATVWQMKTKADGKPANEGGDELVLHIGSGQGIRDRVGANTVVGAPSTNTINLDGLAISFNEYQQTFSLFWNGQRIFQAGPDSTAADLAGLLASPGSTINGISLRDGDPLPDVFLKEAKNFMAPDGGLHNNEGIDTGPELMSWIHNWISNLMTSAAYIRWQSGSFQQEGKTYQGKLIIELANAARYLPFESAFQSTLRLNSLNKALQICIPVEQTIKLSSPDVNFNAYAWSGANPGLHALSGVEFNTDKPIEGANLQRLTAIGDINGDGYQDMVGLGSLASGWNYDYKLDLPNNNLNQRGSDSSSQGETSFILTKGADGKAITRTTLITPVIVWGGPGGINSGDLTPIVRGTPIGSRYLPKGTPGSSTDPGLASLDNFSAAANVLYAPLGDYNGDGFDDLAITDTGTGAADTTGSTYILYGGTGLRDARSYLERFRAFFPETRAKDATNLPIQVAESPDVYLTSNPTGFGVTDPGSSTAWINAINLERSASDTTNTADPAFGAVRVTKITGITSQQLADLSGGGDFSGDGLADVFLTSQSPYKNTIALSQQAPSRYVMFGGDDTRSITLLGTANSDSLKGTPANDVITALAGNDIVQGRGGMDAINAGPGDDQIYVDDDQFRRIDGGSGDDTVILQGQRNQNWDFTRLASAGRIRNIETLDLKDFGANSITLNAAAVRAMSGNGKLILNGDLQTSTPGESIARVMGAAVGGIPAESPLIDALADVISRFASLSFGLSDLSMFPVVLRDVQRDLALDRLRSLAGEPAKRPLTDLLERLEAIDAATPLQPGDSEPGIGLAYTFLQTFGQRLSFTPVSALEAYQRWIANLPSYDPSSWALLTVQQRTDLASFVDVWKNAYASYFQASGQAPAARSFEQYLQNNPNPFPITPIVDSFKAWLASTGVPSYGLPASGDSSQLAFIGQLQDLQSLGADLLSQVLSSFDSVRLSSEFTLINSDVSVGSSRFSEYAANGGSTRVLVPEWMAVLMDPAVVTTLTPTPPTTASVPTPASPGTSLESPDAPVAAPVSLISAAASRDDLRISVSESRLSDDGRALVFTLYRSGFLDETTRVDANTTGYVNDLIPSVHAQVVFTPGVTSQQLLIPLMQALPDEQAALNPYDQALSQNVSLALTLLEPEAIGPRQTSSLALNALNAYTPELGDPTRALDPDQLEREGLFERNLALQFSSALLFTAEATNNEPIRFGLDNPQGQPLNDVLLLDRPSGNLVSLFRAAAAGDAVIYGDNYLSPSTDLYFSVDDGGRYDQDGEVNGQITLAASGATTSPGALVLGKHVLRAPSNSGLNLLFSSGGLNQPLLQGFNELLFVPTDDTQASLHQPDGSLLTPADGQAYLRALLQRLNADSPYAGAVARVPLENGTNAAVLALQGNTQNLTLLNDTNYIPVLSRAAAGSLPSGQDLALPDLSALSQSSRASSSFAITLGQQALRFSLSSPYLLVPGLTGTQLPLTVQFRHPSGSPAEAWHVALLRVADPRSDLTALLASDSLSERLVAIPRDGSLQLQAGDLHLPLLFRGIEPATWAALPAASRALRDPGGAWSVEISDPGYDATPLLQRNGTSTYQVGSDGILAFRYGEPDAIRLGQGRRIVGDAQDNRFDGTSELSFSRNLFLTLDGNDSVIPPGTSGSGENVVFTGAGRDLLSPLQGDAIWSGSDADQIEAPPADQNANGARVDAGTGDDAIAIRGQNIRLLGNAGNDDFRIVGPLEGTVLLSGGAGADHFWLLDSDGQLPDAPLVISDFSTAQGDQLILPDGHYDDLSFQQLDNGVQINIGNHILAILLDRTLPEIAQPANFIFDASLETNSQLVESSTSDPGDQGNTGDGTLIASELVSDGVRGLAAFARRAFGSRDPVLNVYIHPGGDAVTIGGGRLGQQTIDSLAPSDSQLQWIRQQFAILASTLGIHVHFVTDRSRSNLDIYYDKALNIASERSTLGITLNNDNGRQVWTEMVLNADLLQSNPELFQFAFQHELGHSLGLEHPFDNSDGDSEGQAFGTPDGDTTLMSYTRPSEGWPDGYRWLDWQALVSLWGLNSSNPSGWRFRTASGEEVLLSDEQARQRLQASDDGSTFLGRADGQLVLPEITTGSDNSQSTDTQAPTGTTDTDPTSPPTKVLPDSSGGDDPTGDDQNQTLAPPLVILSSSDPDPDAPPSISWQSDWRQLDLELGAVRTADNALLLLDTSALDLEPIGSLRLPNLAVHGSGQDDVVFASRGNTIDLDAGQDTLFSLAAGGGGNHLFGGDHADHLFLAAAGDWAFGGAPVADSQESRSDRDRNSFLIDLDGRPADWRDPAAAIHIGDFQVGLDSLTLISGDQDSSQPLQISAANYSEWREKLSTDFNIDLNAAPTARLAQRGVTLSAEQLRNGFNLEASQFFRDLDTQQELRFVDYDNSLPWLQLNDGRLEVAPNASPSPGSYRIQVAASDGISRTETRSILLAFDPKVVIGSRQVDSGSGLQIKFRGVRGNGAVELLAQHLDANGQPLNAPFSVARQISRQKSLPKVLRKQILIGDAGDALASGNLAFFLKSADQEDPQPLQILQRRNGTFRLRRDNIKVDVKVATENLGAEAPSIDTTPAQGENLIGLSLPADSERSNQVQLNATLYNRSSQDSRVLFYLADLGSGAVVDPLTGEIIGSGPTDATGDADPNYLNDAISHAVWSGSAASSKQGAISVSQQFTLPSGVDHATLTLLPAVIFKEIGGDRAYSSSAFSSTDGVSHIARLSRQTFGFERSSDDINKGIFNDLIARIDMVQVS